MPTLVELLEAGVHFGHKKERSHPRAKDFIFTLREGVYVIDLEKTQEMLTAAVNYLKREFSAGKTVLFVGTKRQAKDIVKELALDLGMPYVNHRWLGGTLTNFETVKKSILELDKLEKMTKAPEFEALTKKEKKVITDKIEKLSLTFGGVKEMNNLPDVLFVIDAAREKAAVCEANRMNIPVVAISDTDANPDNLDYPIPSNDDAPKAIEMIIGIIKSEIVPSKVKVEKEEVPSEEDKEAKENKDEVKEKEEERLQARNTKEETKKESKQEVKEKKVKEAVKKDTKKSVKKATKKAK